MEPVKPTGHCEKHDRPWEWVQLRPGCKRRGCPDCIAGAKQAETDAKHLPLIRYSQTWGRDRALTDKEKLHKPRRRGD